MIYELRTTISVTRLSANAFPTFSSSSHLFSKLFLSFGNLHLLLLHIRYFPSFLAPTISKAHKAWENMRRYPLLSTAGPGGRDGRSSVESCQEHIYHPKCAKECSKIRFFFRAQETFQVCFGVSIARSTVNKKVSHCKR